MLKKHFAESCREVLHAAASLSVGSVRSKVNSDRTGCLLLLQVRT